MLNITIVTLRVSSIAFFLYFMITAYYSGIKSSFLWFYIAFSVSCMVFSFMLPIAYHSQNRLFVICGKLFIICMWAIFSLFIYIQVNIISAANSLPPAGADYIIILGAQVRGKTPSLTLYNRIESAYEYLLDNPDTKVICSGGKGSGEDITEAEAISNVLSDKGISKDRIILEEHSTNTIQNISYSCKYINKESDTIVIVSSDFHIYRALKIAEKTGVHHVYGCSKKDFLITTPGYYVREFFAICKDFIFGHM